MARLRIVLDTNIIIGAHVNKGACYKILERFKQGHFDIFINDHLFQEYSKKLNELLESGKLHSPGSVSENINEIERRAIPVRIPKGIQFPTNDPDDRSLFEITAVTQIDHVVSEDRRDVLAYNGDPTLNGATIVTATEFMQLLNKRDENEKC